MRALLIVPAMALALCPPAARSQATGEGLTLRVTRRDTVTAKATVTAAIAVVNHGNAPVTVRPIIETPAEWTVLMGGSEIAVGPRASEIAMLSVAVPARAAAGLYSIRLRVAALSPDSGEIVDSVMVRVPPRRALELSTVDRPAFVVSGRRYTAEVLVRNRGNMTAQVRVRLKSNLGVMSVSDTTLELASDASALVHPQVLTPAGLESAMDDVLEIAAVHADGEPDAVHTSLRVNIVPEPTRKIEEFQKVPTQVRLRAATSAGVSPFEVFGRGLLWDRGSTKVDFLMRGAAGRYSVFGERDEYRLQLSAPSWRARLGDNFYFLSPLTGAGQPGFGAGLEGSRGRFSAGGYGQHFRHSFQKGFEGGAFLAARPFSGLQVAVNAVDRTGGLIPGQVGSATASLTVAGQEAQMEMAGSNGISGTGGARSARLSGSTSAFAYDVGHLLADTAYSGSQRGSEHTYFTASSQPWDAVSFALTGSSHSSDLSRSTGVPYVEQLEMLALSTTVMGRFTVEGSLVSRSTTVQGVGREARQSAVRGRVDQDVVLGILSLQSEIGRAGTPSGVMRVYSDVSLEARRSLGTSGSVGVWAERYAGGSITKGEQGSLTMGGNATWRRRQTDVSLLGYGTRLRTTGAEWHTQLDAQISQRMSAGGTITLRTRIIGGGIRAGADQRVAYLEYSMPFRLPVSRLRTPGRVYGRVVDATTGLGVPNALVRLGPQVAITDQNGGVAFGGVPGGEHRLSMSQETSFADAVFVGDPTLRVDSARAQPTTFTLAIARSARLDIDVRRFATLATAVTNGGADSLVDAGAVANASLLLTGERDTLYRTTNAKGKVSFTDVPPGTWTVTIRGDAPAFHRFEPDRIELTLAPGESREVAFRLVPRKREVQMIGDDQELRPSTQDPKASQAPGGTRIRRPNNQNHQ